MAKNRVESYLFEQVKVTADWLILLFPDGRWREMAFAKAELAAQALNIAARMLVAPGCVEQVVPFLVRVGFQREGNSPPGRRMRRHCSKSSGRMATPFA